jgi:hypothetical protein
VKWPPRRLSVYYKNDEGPLRRTEHSRQRRLIDEIGGVDIPAGGPALRDRVGDPRHPVRRGLRKQPAAADQRRDGYNLHRDRTLPGAVGLHRVLR